MELNRKSYAPDDTVKGMHNLHSSFFHNSRLIRLIELNFGKIGGLRQEFRDHFPTALPDSGYCLNQALKMY